MKISYENNKLEKKLSDEKKVVREFGQQISDKIYQRLEYLRAAKNLEAVSSSPPYRRHILNGNYKNCFAISITEKQRLIFKPDIDTNKDYKLKEIEKIIIVNIEDYHN